MKQLLADILKNDPGSAMLYRNDDELAFLRGFLSRGLKKENARDKSSFSELSFEACVKCGDVLERKSPYGTGINGVMIILNAPKMANRAELRIHRAESVELLKKMVNAIGIELHECYVTNVIKCETADPFLKPSDMLKNCLNVLKAEIETVKPRIGLVMGELVPVQSIINSSRGISWFNTEHAISLIKNPELKRPAWETLKLIKKRYLETRDAV